MSTDSDVSGAVILSRKMWDKVTFRFGGSAVMPRFGTIAPGIISSFNWQITDYMFGEVEYKWNLDSQLHTRVGWQSSTGNHGVNIGIKICAQDTYLTLYYTYILIWSQLMFQKTSQHEQDNDEWSIDEKNEPIKLKIGGRYGVNSAYGEVGISRRITKFSTFGISLSIGVPLGVMAKFKIIRGNQTFVFPLIMSENLDPAASFYGSLVPMAIFFAVKNLLYDPWKKRELEIEIAKRRQNYQSELKRQRHEAYSAQNLMTETARRSSQQERDKRGLVIERAIYGKLSSVICSNTATVADTQRPGSDDPITQETVDVTIPLQVLVDRSKLLLPACRPGFTRGQLQGFYDPCLGLLSTVGATAPPSSGHSGDTAATNISTNRRQLYVRYKFLNVSHEVIVTDQEQLAIPMERHQVN